MTNDVKNSTQSAKQRLINKVKDSRYAFSKKDFKKFQDFFSKEFSNISLEEVRKHAWRTN